MWRCKVAILTNFSAVSYGFTITHLKPNFYRKSEFLQARRRRQRVRWICQSIMSRNEFFGMRVVNLHQLAPKGTNNQCSCTRTTKIFTLIRHILRIYSPVSTACLHCLNKLYFEDHLSVIVKIKSSELDLNSKICNLYINKKFKILRRNMDREVIV